MKKHIVIIGSGFGGMEVAKRLAPKVRRGEIDVTVINRTNYFLFTPLLHEVATGGLTPTSVTEPLRDVFARSGIRVAQGDVASIDGSKKVVRVGTCDIAYDIVVLASGAETNYYGVPGAEEFGVGLKTLADAIRIRERVIDAFEAAALTNDEEQKRRLLSFVVVGAGATGVELVAELAEFATGIAQKYFGSVHGVSVALVNSGAELLAQFSSATRQAAEVRLRQSGIALKLGVQVKAVDADGIEIGDGSRIDASLVAWTAGVKPSLPNFVNAAPEMVNGRITVDDTLRAKKSDSLFVVGDSAALESPLPMLAQVAVAEGKAVARNIIAQLEGNVLVPFSYTSRGSLVSLGQWFAAGTVGKLDIAGRFTWWIWRTVYLFKFASTKKRIRIAFEWTINLFYPRDITKLS